MHQEYNPSTPAVALRAVLRVLAPEKIKHEKDVLRALTAWEVEREKLRMEFAMAATAFKKFTLKKTHTPHQIE